ncbi:MAG: CHASE3 domain-containing protein [Candidatus Brocadiaceae bacterium]
MKLSLIKKVTIGFAIALALLIFVSVFSYRHITKLLDDVQWVKYTHEVIENLDGMLSSMEDIEAVERGYIITGKDRYLEPYYNAKKVINQKVNHIRTLTADNPKQQSRLDALQPRITEKITHTDKVVNLRKNKGFFAARQLVQAGKGKQPMDDIRRMIGEMKNEENILLKQRLDKEKASTTIAIYTIVFGNTIAFVLIVLAYLVVKRDIAEHTAGVR